MRNSILEAAEILKAAKYTIAFTGAGISAESGIPTYRGKGGVWLETNPKILELSFFLQNPEETWAQIRDKFYRYFGKITPNSAHYTLSNWQTKGFLCDIITQNIDHLHQDAGCHSVHEFHGTLHSLSCVHCGKQYKASTIDMHTLPFCTACSKRRNFLKPNFVFFGEGIPEKAYDASIKAAEKADVCIIIGTSGLVRPAATIPHFAHENGTKIIEINLEPSNYTDSISDVFLAGKATEILAQIDAVM